MEVRSDRGAIILRPAKLERKIRGRHRIEDLMGTMPKNYKPQEMKWGVRGKEVW